MKLVMTLLVRDEEDILAANLAFHAHQGVDFFIITDNNSVDATPEIARRYQAAGKAHVLHETGDDYSQARWVTRMARLAAADFGADWIINSDADEFWWPKSGTLHEVFAALPEAVNALEAKRVNFPPAAGREEPEMVFWRRMRTREVVSRNPHGLPLPPKLAHRGRADVSVLQGNHAVVFDGASIQKSVSEPLIILHFPMRSYRQFENKIRCGGAAYERNTDLPYEIGFTWRDLYRRYQAGELDEAYSQHLLSEQAIQDGIERGALIKDVRLATYLHRLETARVASL